MVGGDGKVAENTIDITPTWAGMVPVLIALIESGDAEGRKTARAELGRMAELADLYGEVVKTKRLGG